MIAITGIRIPPKLPDTTNLVFTRSKNEYKEMRAIAASVRVENKRPPLKKLTTISARRRKILLWRNSRLSQKQNPSPNERFQKLKKNWANT